MIQITFSLDEGALSSVRQDPATLTREMRLAAAVKWYELHRISQGRAAEIAGLSRSDFIDALGRYGVSPFQESIDDLAEAMGEPPPDGAAARAAGGDSDHTPDREAA